jgi:hypothetical protein
MNKKLTIGMATYDDFDGVFFSVQSLRMHHPICQDDDVEIIILDNNPMSSHGQECKNFSNSGNNIRYIEHYETISSFNKYKIAKYATGKYILIMDCHVLLQNGAIDALLNYFEENPNCNNLVQGPLIYDDLRNISTHFDPRWSGDMYGVWATNKDMYLAGKPFSIPMQGMGLLAFEKSSWKGINQNFKGFGGEEGYIAAKFRQWGGDNICLPQLGWNHRFGRPNGVKYPLILEDRIWNYFIGWLEITQDPEHPMIKSIYEYFSNRIPKWSLDKILDQSKLTVLNKGE